MNVSVIQGAGLGLRRELLDQLGSAPVADFLEIAPENWLGVGGRLGKALNRLSQQYPILCHGLCLSLGGPDPLDTEFLRQLKAFLQQHRVPLYSEHLSYSAVDGHLYDLLPIPFTGDAVRHVSQRIQQVQDALNQRIAIENVSYYATPAGEMDELQFIGQVLQASDCLLLLDVNNLYVNSINHGYDPRKFLQGLPADRIAYMHVAGHERQSEHLLVDTHGASVTDPVWQLLQDCYQEFGPLPTLLERDFDIPPLTELLPEIEQIRRLQQASR